MLSILTSSDAMMDGSSMALNVFFTAHVKETSLFRMIRTRTSAAIHVALRVIMRSSTAPATRTLARDMQFVSRGNGLYEGKFYIISKHLLVFGINLIPKN